MNRSENIKYYKQPIESEDKELATILEKQLKELLANTRPMFGNQDWIEIERLLGKVRRNLTLAEKNSIRTTLIYLLKKYEK